MTRLRPGDTFVDVGASCGWFTLVAAMAVGPNGHVIAIEPGPSQFQRLVTNIETNHLASTVSAVNVAAADRTGKAALYIPPGNDQASSIVQSVGRGVEVSTEPLDVILERASPNLIKIDAEGSEAAIIRGCEQTFSRNPELKLVAEWNRSYADERLWAALHELGDVFRIIESSNETILVQVNNYEEAAQVVLGNMYVDVAGKRT